MNIKTPSVTVGRLRELLRYDADTGLLHWKVRRNQYALEGSVAGHVHSSRGKLYFRVRVDNNLIMGHWIVWAMRYGDWPTTQIDHEDGDGLNNRVSNLRLAPQSVNNKNAALRKDNKTGVTGVVLSRCGHFVAIIKNKGAAVHLGTFRTLKEAAEARKAAEVKYGFHPNHGKRKFIGEQPA